MSLLDVTDDLDCTEEASKLSAKDAEREFEQLNRGYASVEEEKEKAKAILNDLDRPCAEYSKTYIDNTDDFLESSSNMIKHLKKSHQLMIKKVRAVVEYFAEDVNSCESVKIFLVLQQFRVAVEVSKQAAIRRSLTASKSFSK